MLTGYDIIIFCPSYVQVENTLYLIKKYKEKKIVLLLYGHLKLKKFFNDIIKIKCLMNVEIIDLFENKKSVYKQKKYIQTLIRKNIDEFILVRKIYQKYFKNIKNKYIYFSSLFYDSYTYYFIKKIKKNNKVIYFAPQNYQENIPQKVWLFTFKDLYRIIKTKIIFGFGLHYYKFSVRKMPYISFDFLRKLYRIIDIEERKSLVNIKEIYSEYDVWNLDKYQVLLLDTPFQRDGVVLSSKLNSEMERILKYIARYYHPNTIAIKLHPGDPPIYKYSNKSGSILPDYIMAQFLTYKKLKIVIGFWSTVMNQPQCKTIISLIDLVSFLDNNLKSVRKEYLLSRADKAILFPNSFEQFDSILKGIK